MFPLRQQLTVRSCCFPGELYIGGQEHFYLETHCTIAVPKGEAGEMELFVSTQNTMKTQVGVLWASSGAWGGHRGAPGIVGRGRPGPVQKGIAGYRSWTRPCHHQVGVTELVR